jgi:Zn-dependent metalloprotease
MIIGADRAANDVVGHEFTHGIIENTTGFIAAGESGALNEHYGDVIGNSIFADTNMREWKVAEQTKPGAVRDMVDPTTLGDPGHYGYMTASCWDPIWCTHSWAGIPNRAAVLIAQGGVPGLSHPGIDRDRLGQLWLAALAKGGMSDLFLDQRLNVWNTCKEAIATPINGRGFSSADCDLIGRAFDTVGVMAPSSSAGPGSSERPPSTSPST